MKKKNLKNISKNKPIKGKDNPTPVAKKNRGPVLKTFDDVRKYLNKVIRKLEGKEIEPKVGNSIGLICNLVLACIKHELEYQEFTERLNRLEVLLKDLQQNKSGSKGFEYPVIDLTEKKTREILN